MTVTFKDFEKDAKDVISKNYQGGAWKVECKAKGPKDTFYFNPVVEKGVISTDIQYDLSCCATKTKLTVDQNGSVKDKVTYTTGPHTIEATGQTTVGGPNCCKAWKGEFSHELKGDAFNAKTTVNLENGKDTAAGVGLVYDVNSNIAVGANVNLVNFALKGYSAGLRFTQGGIFASAVYQASGDVAVHVKYPLNIADKDITTVAAISRSAKDGKISPTFALETKCVLCPGATVRAKCAPGTGAGLAWIKKVNDVWKIATSVERSKDGKIKFGVLFTHE